MQNFLQFFSRGIWFVRNNPQIIYTLFLVFAIPLAFFVSSEQFLQVASENQNRLEQSRIALLEDAFVAFIPPGASHAYVADRISKIVKENQTIDNIEMIVPTTTPSTVAATYEVFASLNEGELGSAYTPDDVANILIPLARGDTTRSYAYNYTNQTGRHWKSIRAIPSFASSSLPSFVLVDVSMAEADAVSERNIERAYAMLVGIILLIILLLARQARIIDYSTLYTRLKEVDQMKDDFISMAAHELRSPLTVIRAYVEMLGEEEGVSEISRQHLKQIDASALNLSGLVGDILDVSKLQEGRMSFHLSVLDPKPIIEDVAEGLSHVAEQKSLSLSVELTQVNNITADPDRLRQVLVNLIGNAIKYTIKGSVTVATSIVKGRLQIRVSDTGLGISAEDQQHMFEKFYRVKSEETEKIQGTGLGLWITHQMIKEMGGDISIESIKGKGSDFIVSFKTVE